MTVTDIKWNVELNLTCPECNHYFDGLSEYLRHDIKYLCEHIGWDMVFICPNCEKEITVDFIEEYIL